MSLIHYEMSQNGIRSIFEKNHVIPVVTFNNATEVDLTVDKLTQLEINCMEITLRTSFALEAIAYAKKNYGSTFKIGVGTITTRNQIQQVTDLDVDFMVSPGICKELAPYFEQSLIPFIPGVATPSEIIQGLQFGWDTFKFFPANLYGGIPALKTFGQVFPNVRFCPTGGIKENDYLDYLALENVVAVGGSWMN
ncbi:MAG: bifunctional 4-hydroxy-2-oxoglutarate aldolase/2-dehydro-3-deoxy-phosphogluconate aldolase [Crocinitomicaceae bacterium]